MLSRIFGPKREEVAGDWRTLHVKELCIVYASTNITGSINSRGDKIGVSCSPHGEVRNGRKT